MIELGILLIGFAGAATEGHGGAYVAIVFGGHLLIQSWREK